MISRRLFLRTSAAAGAVGATIAAPVVVEAAQIEPSHDRVPRLMRELQEALTEFCDGQFKAVVYPAMHKAGSTHLADADPQPKAQAISHMRSLRNLAFQDGADDAYVALIGHFGEECRLIGINTGGSPLDFDGMFVPKGGVA